MIGLWANWEANGAVSTSSCCRWLGLLLLGAGSLAAESTGRVQGVLKDQDGGIVQGARVEIKSLDSSLTRSAVTDGQGRYAFDALPAGRYQVSAGSPGFATAVRTDIAVTEERAAVVDLVLNVAGTETVVVVTAPKTSRPLVVETDPRAPRQPIPAHDGADYLKNIPGFSIIRKGGSDGDPVLRGMAGSRLSILMDGQQIFGGCGGRMDPPTAYVFPAAYDRITVLKGPETVLYGPDASAGAVLFEREIGRAARAGYQVHSSLTLGGYGRHDEMMDARAALPSFYVQAIATRSHSRRLQGRQRQRGPLLLHTLERQPGGRLDSGREHSAGGFGGQEQRRGGLRRPHDGRLPVRPRQRGAQVREKEPVLADRQDRGADVLQLHRSCHGQLQRAHARRLVFGHEPRPADHGGPLCHDLSGRRSRPRWSWASTRSATFIGAAAPWAPPAPLW